DRRRRLAGPFPPHPGRCGRPRCPIRHRPLRRPFTGRTAILARSQLERSVTRNTDPGGPALSSRMTTTDSWIALLAARYEDRFPALSPRAKVVQSLRVLELEIRRSPAVIAALVIAIVTAWVMWEALPKGVV